MIKKLKNNKAFTLVELSVVIVIVSFLVVGILKGKPIVASFKCFSGKSTNSSDSISTKDMEAGLAAAVDGNDPSGEEAIFKANRSKSFRECVEEELNPTEPVAIAYGNCVDYADCKTSCKKILDSHVDTTSGTYTIDPDGEGGVASFAVYCDMTDGGGWTKILHYKNQAYTPTVSEVNVAEISTSVITGFAKLSDARINSIGGSGTKIYKFDSDAYTTDSFYVKTNVDFVDTSFGFNFPNNNSYGCHHVSSVDNCTWSWSNIAGIDSHLDGAPNDSGRYFADYHVGNSVVSCYDPPTTGVRCLASGSTENHKMHTNLSIFVREES